MSVGGEVGVGWRGGISGSGSYIKSVMGGSNNVVQKEVWEVLRVRGLEGIRGSGVS